MAALRYVFSDQAKAMANPPEPTTNGGLMNWTLTLWGK